MHPGFSLWFSRIYQVKSSSIVNNCCQNWESSLEPGSVHNRSVEKEGKKLDFNSEGWRERFLEEKWPRQVLRLKHKIFVGREPGKVNIKYFSLRAS